MIEHLLRGTAALFQALPESAALGLGRSQPVAGDGLVKVLN